MIRAGVISSNLKGVGYDVVNKILEVEFVGGGIWHYFEVPKEAYDKLMSSPSKGGHFYGYIKGKFKGERLSVQGEKLAR